MYPSLFLVVESRQLSNGGKKICEMTSQSTIITTHIALLTNSHFLYKQAN